ncbi:STAS domain-containing protein [Streptomyces sp. NPDC059442]|uniref:STAS domain-containing protein n=1 Tax=Streptomyces sp. NPDC059442 TaxID=3346830 RepID=UPI0036B99328
MASVAHPVPQAGTRSTDSTVTVVAVPGSAHTRVRIAGEVDLDSAGHLRATLMRVLATSPDRAGLALDMSAVTFCDSIGLNTLLRLRLQALDEGRTLTITDASPQVARLLEVTGSAGLFTP